MQIKYIADPSMHSIPAVAVHPNKQFFVGTSLDNQIVTYAARDRFRQNRKKVFKVRRWQLARQEPHALLVHLTRSTAIITQRLPGH